MSLLQHFKSKYMTKQAPGCEQAANLLGALAGIRTLKSFRRSAGSSFPPLCTMWMGRRHRWWPRSTATLTYAFASCARPLAGIRMPRPPPVRMRGPFSCGSDP